MAMTIADFTGAEAEELRRAMGFKRAELKMRGIEERLRAGMSKKGIEKETQDKIVLAITSFARYGFPESHAASFALIAYASAYLKCHYLPAFTCALINNQPMGFYSPAVLVKDAQRHGLRVLPTHVNASEWNCTIEERSLRLGLRCVRGLRAVTGEAIALAKPFSDIDEFAQRIPADAEKRAGNACERRCAQRHRCKAPARCTCGKPGGREGPSDLCWRAFLKPSRNPHYCR